MHAEDVTIGEVQPGRTRILSPGQAFKAARTAGSNASHASGAHSSPCLGADAGLVSVDWTVPTGVSSMGGGCMARASPIRGYSGVGSSTRMLQRVVERR
jgi:hypothetical protein